MPVTLDQIQRLEQTPQFATLPYEEQLRLRSGVMNKYLIQEPDFIQLNDKVKQKVYEKLLYRPPVFEKKRKEVERILPMIEQKRDPKLFLGMVETLFPQVKWGMALDPEQKKDRKDLQLLRYTYALNFIRKFNKSSVLAEGIRRAVTSGKKADDTQLFFTTGLWKGVNRFFDKAIDRGTGEGIQQALESDSNDTSKLIAYMDYNMNKDAKLRRMLMPMNFLSNVGGVAADLYVGYQAVTGAAQSFFSGLTAGKGISSAILAGIKPGKATAFQKLMTSRFLGKVAPPLLHAAGDGILGTMRESLNDVWLKGMKDIPTQQRMMNAAKYFGEYALGDILFFAAGRVMKNFTLSSARFIKGFKPDSVKMEKVTSVIEDVLKMKDIDPVWFARQDDITKETLRQLQSTMATFDKVERLTPENAFKVFSGSKGFLALPEKDGWKMLHLLDDKLRKSFSSMDKAAEWVMKESDRIGWTLKGSTPQLAGTSLKNIQVQGKLKFYFPKASKEGLKVLSDSIAPIGGKFTSEGVETFAKGFLKAGGASDDLIKNVKVVTEGNNLKVMSKGGELFTLPQYASNAGVEFKTVSDLSKKLNDLLPVEQKFVPIYKEQVKKRALYTPSWVEDFVKQHDGVMQSLPEGRMQATIQGKVIEGADHNEIADEILKQFAVSDPGMVKTYLANYEGIKLTQTKEGKFILKKGKTLVSKKPYDSLDALFSDRPDLIPRIPSDYGPKVTLVNNQTLAYNQGLLTGSETDILTELSKFKDVKRGGHPFKFKDATVVPLGTEFEVTVKNLGYKETFNSMDKVQEFLNKGLYEKLDYIAPRKGFILTPYNGQFHLTTSGGKTFVADSLDEAAGLLSNKGIMPEWAPELTGIDAQLAKSLKKLPGFQYKPQSPMPQVEPKNLSSFDIFQSMYRAPDQFFRKAFKKGVSGADDVLKQFRRVEDTRDVITGMTQRLAPLIDDVFKTKAGKALKVKDRRLVTALLEMDHTKWDDFIGKNKLKSDIKEIAENVRSFYGQHAEDGLFLYMGNDPNTFLKRYAPVIRKHLTTSTKHYAGVDDLLKDAFSEQVPKGLDVFFKHSRVEDVAELVREMDAKTLLQKYVMLGHREKFLGPLVEDISKWAVNTKGKVDEALLRRFTAYIGDVVGIPSTLGEKMAQDFTSRFFKEMKIGDKVLAKNFTEVMMGTSYLATMGWRAYLPIRNSFQIWTTLAPRVGNTWTAQALKTLNADKVGDVYRMLQKRGIITSGLPVGGATLFKGGDVTAKVMKSGLHWYKNSDSFTRAVAYLACKSRFDDAVLRFQKGLTNQKRFIKQSGLWNLAEDRLDQALQLINKGQADSAMDLFGREMVTETMFPYRAGTQPLAFRGVVGKLFGQMGHYPVYWLENIRRGLGRGSFIQRGAYAARFLGNTTAIAGALGAIGIRSNSFLAWGPAQFTGGPWYDLINQGVQLWGGGYEGRVARSKLLGIKERDGAPYWDLKALSKSQLFQMLIPGSLAARSLIKAGNYLNQGDYFKFIMSLGSVPLKT